MVLLQDRTFSYGEIDERVFSNQKISNGYSWGFILFCRWWRRPYGSSWTVVRHFLCWRWSAMKTFEVTCFLSLVYFIWRELVYILQNHTRQLKTLPKLSHDLESSVGLSASIQSAGDLVSGPRVQTLHSAAFDLNIACLCQSIEINNNKYVYRQSQVRKSTDSGVKWAECSLIIGTGCRVHVFSLILDS